MKSYAPNYYQGFACINQRCRHNCCIGWEIDIDEETYARYQRENGEFASRLQAGIFHGEAPCFRLGEGERCMFLNENNLCDIILHLGEDALCWICSDHPRYRNFFSDREELGLGLCCEAAAERILTQKEKTAWVCLSGDDEEPEAEEMVFFALRERVVAMMQNREIPVTARIAQAKREFELSLPEWGYAGWAEVLKNLERLDDAWEKMIEELSLKKEIPISFCEEKEIAYEQLLVYFIFRHLAEGLYDGRTRERLAFSLVSTELLMALSAEKSLAELIDIARAYSAEIEYSEANLETMLELTQTGI